MHFAGKMPTEHYDSGTAKSGKREEGGLFSKFGTLTKKKNKNEQQQQPTGQGGGGPGEEPERKEEDEADLVEKLGKDAIDSCLILPQPDLRNLEDGLFGGKIIENLFPNFYRTEFANFDH